MKTLNIHSFEELGDLIEWTTEHPDEGYTQAQRDALGEWLAGLAVGTHPVPPELVDILDALIEDWCDVIASHDEEFHTTLR